MSKCSSGDLKKRKPRTSFNEKDKRIFLNIIKNSEGGRFAKVITSKDSESESNAIPATNQQRHDVWKDLSKIFSRSISKEVDNEQCKQLWFRIKGEAKKKHDGKVMSFKRTCAITGGGQAPQPPPDIDGDDLDPL